MKKFNYQEEAWAVEEARLSFSNLAFLRLKYALLAFKKTSGKVLEVGCGAGGFLKGLRFYRQDLELFGIDISKKAIKIAKSNSKSINFRVGDVYLLPYKKENFKAVIVSDVLEHLENPKLALGEIYRVLKRGGILYCYAPCEGNRYTLHGLLSGISPFKYLKKKYAGHIQRFSTREIISLFQKSGFKMKEVYFSEHFFGQILDISYFWALEVFGKKPKIIKFLRQNISTKRSLRKKSKFSLVIRSVLLFISYLESIILRKVPALGVHLIVVK